MHNGTVNAPKTHDHKRSDTWNFIETWLKPMFQLVKNPHDLIRSEAFKILLEHEIGTGNRIIMGDRGGYITFNESTWHTMEGEYFPELKGLVVSNTYAWDRDFGKPKPVVTYKAPKVTKGQRRNAWGQLLTNIVGNVFHNDAKQVWLDSHGTFIRCSSMDAQLDTLKKAYSEAHSKQLRKELRKSWKKQADINQLHVPSSIPTPSLIQHPNGGLIGVKDQSKLTLSIKEQEALEVVCNQGVIYLPASQATNEELDSRDEAFQTLTALSEIEYTDLLVKEWATRTPAMIHTLVYSDPEEAAKVLCRILPQARV